MKKVVSKIAIHEHHDLMLSLIYQDVKDQNEIKMWTYYTDLGQRTSLKDFVR